MNRGVEFDDNLEQLVVKSWFMITCGWFILHVRPLNWHLIYKDLVKDTGDLAYHHVWCLCLYLEFETLSQLGRERREYRRKLRESGEWSGTGQPELKIDKEAFMQHDGQSSTKD